MTHIFFDPDNIDWTNFLTSQEGRGKYFIGTRYQRGYGILQNIARFLLPVAKNVLTAAGQEGLTVGSKVLSDVVQGKNIKEALAEHSRTGIENLGKKFEQCGKGKKKRKRDQLTF
jgi:hypothetical protein